MTRHPGSGRRLYLHFHPHDHPRPHHRRVPYEVSTSIGAGRALATGNDTEAFLGPPQDSPQIPLLLALALQLVCLSFFLTQNSPFISMHPIFLTHSQFFRLLPLRQLLKAVQNTSSFLCPILGPPTQAGLKAACCVFNIKLRAEAGELALGLCVLKTNAEGNSASFPLLNVRNPLISLCGISGPAAGGMCQSPTLFLSHSPLLSLPPRLRASLLYPARSSVSAPAISLTAL